MAGDAWFRNEEWNEEIALAFERKLGRARCKGQYLRIQASLLAGRHPEVALALLDRYFSLGEDFDIAQAHVDRATAYLHQGRLEPALQSLEHALERERVFPKLRTVAAIDLPYLVAIHEVFDRYRQAMEILDGIDAELMLMFPVDRFKYHAARALMLVGHDPPGALSAARLAQEAAASERSGLRYHPAVGLVSDSHAAVICRLRDMCNS